MLFPLLLVLAAPPVSPYGKDPFAGRTMIVATDNTGKWVRVALRPNDALRKRIDAALARALEWPPALKDPGCNYHRDVLLSAVGTDRELGICFGCNVAAWGPKGTTVQIRSNHTVGSVEKARDELIYLFREATGVQRIPLNPAKNPAPRPPD